MKRNPMRARRNGDESASTWEGLEVRLAWSSSKHCWTVLSAYDSQAQKMLYPFRYNQRAGGWVNAVGTAWPTMRSQLNKGVEESLYSFK